MKTFSKKTDLTLLFISLVAICISSLLVLLSGSLSNWIYLFLQNVVFKREFNFDKWADTINSLIAFPIFITIFVDSLIFLKLSNKSKFILLSFFTLLISIFIVFCSYTTDLKYMNSDMASELLLAKECYLNKSFLPRSWHYSTEIRMLNTQIFTAPIFIFTSNLKIIKTISAIIICFLLPLSLWFLLSQLKIKTSWLKYLSLLLIFTPASSYMWEFVQYGSYYVPHIAIAFTYTALFIAITFNKNELSNKQYKVFLILFLILSFISGLSGIRYILYFELPLAITIISIKVSILFNNKENFNFRNFFITDKKAHLSLVSLFLGGFGYILNTLVLSKIYSFSDFNTTKFTHIGDISFSTVHNGIFEILGYKNNVSVFTPSGINNILIYIFFGFFFINIIKYLRHSEESSKKTFIIFSLILFVFNAFTFINTEYYNRYFLLILPFMVPTVVILTEEVILSIPSRFITILCLSVVLLSSSFILFEDNICIKSNEDKVQISQFLSESEYEFGYATFWNANVFTYTTNDKIKLANLYRYKENEIEKITDSFKCDKWLTPESYYQNDFGNNNKIILIVTNAEYYATPDANIFKNGKQVYSDSYYKIFEYTDNKTFKESF